MVLDSALCKNKFHGKSPIMIDGQCKILWKEKMPNQTPQEGPIYKSQY